MRGRVICAGCAEHHGVCNWRGEFFCPTCTGALVHLARDLNEIPTAEWEQIEFGEWALAHETAVVQEWLRS